MVSPVLNVIPDKSIEPSIATLPLKLLYVSGVAPLDDTEVTYNAASIYSSIVIIIPSRFTLVEFGTTIVKTKVPSLLVFVGSKFLKPSPSVSFKLLTYIMPL